MLIVRCLRFWCVAWLIAGFIATLACAGKYSIHSHRVALLDDLNTRATPLYELASETTECKRDLARLEGRESLLATLDSSNQPFQLMGVVSQSAAVVAGNLCIESFNLQTVSESKNTTQNNNNSLLTRRRRTRTPPKKTIQAAEEEQVELTLRGTCSNDVAIAQFVSQLRQYEIFDSVVLHSSNAEAKDGEKQFHVGCKYSK